MVYFAVGTQGQLMTHTIQKMELMSKIHLGKTLLLNIIWIFAPKFEDLRFYHFDFWEKNGGLE